jgi:hypothetical protein
VRDLRHLCVEQQAGVELHVAEHAGELQADDAVQARPGEHTEPQDERRERLAAGLLWFSRLPVDGSFLADVLGPSLLVGLGLALSFVALTIGSVSGVDEGRYGLASGLVNTSQQIGGALGLGILTAVAAGRTESAGAGIEALNEGSSWRCSSRAAWRSSRWRSPPR